MKRVVGLVFLLLAGFALPSSFGSGTAVRDLGEGLVYCRATTATGSGEFALPVELSGEEQGRQSALVFDLRYAQGGEVEAERLSGWLVRRADAAPETRPVFFLVNAETGFALREAAARFAQNYPALLIGSAPADGGDFLPDISLEIDAEEERAAYAALASGEADIGALIAEGAAANKRRYDEAAVIAAHAAPENERRLTRAESTEPIPEVTGARPVDLALQRAIYLHRAWRVFEPHPQP